MLSAPTVGVIVANHDNSAFVGKAIESVARQTVRNLQVIVVDDASPMGRTRRSGNACRGSTTTVSDM